MLTGIQVSDALHASQTVCVYKCNSRHVYIMLSVQSSISNLSKATLQTGFSCCGSSLSGGCFACLQAFFQGKTFNCTDPDCQPLPVVRAQGWSVATGPCMTQANPKLDRGLKELKGWSPSVYLGVLVVQTCRVSTTSRRLSSASPPLATFSDRHCSGQDSQLYQP